MNTEYNQEFSAVVEGIEYSSILKFILASFVCSERPDDAVDMQWVSFKLTILSATENMPGHGNWG